MPEGTVGQTYANTPAATGKMIRANNSILNLTQLLERMLTAVQNIDVDIDSVTINTQEVEDALERIRQLTIITNNLIAAGNVDLAAIEALITAGNAILTTIDADTGNIVTAVQLIDDYVGTIDAAFSGKVAVIGGKAESTVPTEVADADAVALWMDTFGRMVQVFTDLATGTAAVTDSAPAQMQKMFETDWVAQTAPNDVTAARSVRDYENILISYIIASIDTSVDLIIWGSFDGGTTYHPIWTDTILAADEQDDTVSFVGMALTHVYCEFDGEAGGTAAVVTWEMGVGN